MVGTVLSNRYKLIAELGSGGMAWVYMAEDLREGQKVAVKVLYPQHSQDLGFLQRFIREAKLAMSLSLSSPPPHIVRVLDYGADRDTHYLVMEFTPGRDLGQILDQEGSLLWQRALNLARQVALALDHAARHEIVHRDIKPSNVMVLADGTARVLDFGIARARTSPDLTLSGFVGSPNYAAPEQATGQPVDIRADIYSLGVVLYKMLSGNLPFEGDTPWAVVNQHISSPPPPLGKICPDLPESVVRLVQKAMAKRPEDRFQTPAEMVLAIEAVLAGLDLPAEELATGPDEVASTLEELYQLGRQAVEHERWQEAVDLFSRILKADPDYRDVTHQLSEIGQQIRLAALYRSVRRALQIGNWDQAITQLDKIAEIAPDYRDVAGLRTRAESRKGPKAGQQAVASEFPTQISEDLEIVQAPVAVRDSDGEPLGQRTPASGSGRRRALIWASTLALVLVLAGASYWLYRTRQSPVALPAASPEPSPTVALLAASPEPSPTLTVRATDSPVVPTDTPSPTHTSVLPTRTPRPTNTSPALPTTVTPSPVAGPVLTPTPTVRTVVTTEPPLTGQIAFPRFDTSRGTYDVYVCRVDGSNCRRVAAESSQPDFLPGGTQLVVHSWKADEKGLVLQSLSGERIWRITDRLEAARPSVDFQGELYVYHSRQEVDRQPRLYRTYGAETRPILREASVVLGLSPAWLPDGRILYGGCWLDACGILVMRADGTNPRQVVAGSAETNPEASPDGQQVAFMSQRDGDWEVYVVNLDGSGLQRLSRHPANDGLPAWSPDGRHIAFVSDRDGAWAVWVMRPNGDDLRRLFGLGGALDGRVQDAAPHEIHGWVEERISWAPLP